LYQPDATFTRPDQVDLIAVVVFVVGDRGLIGIVCIGRCTENTRIGRMYKCGGVLQALLNECDRYTDLSQEAR
jgi:hypothetical protein